MRFPEKKRIRPVVHLTALIDIVFLLLVFFLLASSFVDQQGVAIVVPEVDSEQAEISEDIIIKVDQHGGFFLAGISVGERDLYYLLKEQLDSSSKANVTIQADFRVQYDSVVQAIDVAKLAGAENIILATQRNASVELQR